MTLKDQSDIEVTNGRINKLISVPIIKPANCSTDSSEVCVARYCWMDSSIFSL